HPGRRGDPDDPRGLGPPGPGHEPGPRGPADAVRVRGRARRPGLPDREPGPGLQAARRLGWRAAPGIGDLRGARLPRRRARRRHPHRPGHRADPAARSRRAALLSADLLPRPRECPASRDAPDPGGPRRVVLTDREIIEPAAWHVPLARPPGAAVAQRVRAPLTPWARTNRDRARLERSGVHQLLVRALGARADPELAALGHVDDGGGAAGDLAGQNRVGEQVLDAFLDHALEGAGAVLGVVALLGQALEGGGGDLEADLL